MVALLKTKIPRESREARIELEQIVRESPRHLNALADLETIYRNLYRITEDLIQINQERYLDQSSSPYLEKVM
jgi:hypothetical protein